MLVLQCSVDEEVVIIGPDGVEIGRVMVVAHLGHEALRLGFTFPRDYQIHRTEVADRIGRGVLDGSEDFRKKP